MKSLGRMIMLVLAVFSIAASTGWARDKVPVPEPEWKDCDVIDDTEYNNRLNCKTENVNSALYGFVDKVIEYDETRVANGRGNLLTETQRENLRSARGRAQSAKNRTHEVKGFKGVAKKQKSQDETCYIKQLPAGLGGPADQDGICQKGETCAEDNTDGIGDDDGICEDRNGPKKDREVCLEVCTQPLGDEEDNYDPNAAGDMEDGLDELEKSLGEAQQKVEMLMMAEMAIGEHQSLSGEGSLGVCGDFGDDSTSWITFGFMQAMQVAKNAANATLDSCAVVCNQDAFGWNCEAACLPLAIGAGIINGLHDGLELTYKMLDEFDAGDQMAKMAQCSVNLGSDVTTVKSDIRDLKLEAGNTNRSLDDIKEELVILKSLLDQNQNLLLTPQGKREGFSAR